jgi:hypothetical protein
MNAQKSPSEYTPGAWWVWAEYQPLIQKLSKSQVASQWFLVSSWSSESSAEAACATFRSMK